jgi:hypothetical protein
VTRQRDKARDDDFMFNLSNSASRPASTRRPVPGPREKPPAPAPPPGRHRPGDGVPEPAAAVLTCARSARGTGPRKAARDGVPPARRSNPPRGTGI